MVTIVAPMLIVAALVVSFFYVGANIGTFSISQTFLVLAVFWAMWRTRALGLIVPRTPLTITLLLYWAWLAITLLWTPIPFVSVTMCWWLFSLPIAFWAYVGLPPGERNWQLTAALLVTTGLAVGSHGLYQFFLFGSHPQSVFLDSNILATLMYLLALPVCGYFLLCMIAANRNPVKTWLVGAVYAVLVYVLMLTRSRGGLLAFLIGTFLLLITVHRQLTARRVSVVVGIILVAYLFADLAWQGGLSERTASLLNPVNAGSDRFAIWRQSWRLLFEQSPMWGVGLGLYSLVWPPYRGPTDTSGGFFVHNDYLQIWIEAGLPGLLFLLGFLGGTTWTVWRLLGRTRTVAVRIEAASLFAAFAAVALGSIVQYNFYVIPLLLVMGLGLGRLEELGMTRKASKPQVWTIRPLRHVSSRGYGLILSLGMLFPLGYFFSIGVSAYQSSRAEDFMAQGRLHEAERALILAERLWADSDAPRMARADLYRQIMTQTADEQKKQILFQDAERLLMQAETLNPLRMNIFLLRADLYRQASHLTASVANAQIEANLRHALALNPRHYPTRLRYALLLLANGQEQLAVRILEEGIHYRYRDNPGVVSYLELTARLRDRRGDHDGAEMLRRRIRAILNSV